MRLRLNQFIAHTGLCSRRKADNLITAGKIKVNTKTTTQLHTWIDPTVDIVHHQGKQLLLAPKVYYLLNKPSNTITTRHDPQGRKTVCDYLPRRPKVYPVGRLDRNTTGLLLLTNDGKLAKHLAHPSSETPKRYHITLSSNLTLQHFNAISKGITLADGPVPIDNFHFLSPHRNRLSLTIHIGRNRIIRRLFAHLGYSVTQLDRVQYAHLTKANLPLSHWRKLTPQEVAQLSQRI